MKDYERQRRGKEDMDKRLQSLERQLKERTKELSAPRKNPWPWLRCVALFLVDVGAARSCSSPADARPSVSSACGHPGHLSPTILSLPFKGSY